MIRREPLSVPCHRSRCVVRPCPQVQQIEAELVREEKLLSKKQVPDIWERWHIHVASRLD